jgi:hypothetical protein
VVSELDVHELKDMYVNDISSEKYYKHDEETLKDKTIKNGHHVIK